MFCIMAYSCSNELHMLFPEGPAGPQGEDGKSAYEVWVEEVNNGTVDWPKDRTDVNNFFLFLKGKDGKDGVNGNDGDDGKSAYELWVEEVNKGLENPHNPGHNWPKDQTELNDFWYYLAGADGKNGVTPNIGDNGNWWVNGEDTGVPATGEDGKPGHTPEITIGDNGNWYIDGEDTGMPSRGEAGPDGKPGHTPEVTIGDNGNWYIDGVDTGKPARGPQGDDGEKGEDGDMPDITIGDNGNWYINGEDTGKPAQGPQGDDGEKGEDGDDGEKGDEGEKGEPGETGPAGQSAYELWVEEVEAGRAYKNGEPWPKNRTSVQDFWDFLRGEDGQDGKPGQDGQDGATIILGSPNVIIQYYGDPDIEEYVDWADGSVTYKVYDSRGKVASAGTIVKGIPDSQSEYTVDGEGFIEVPATDLPVNRSYENIEVDVKIAGESAFEKSANNTIVPARMQVRLVVNESKIPTVGLFGVGDDQAKPCVNLWFKVQRKKLDADGSGEWEGIPAALGNTQKTVEIYEYKDGVQSDPTVVETRTQIEVAADETGVNYNNCRVQIKRKFIYTALKYLDKDKVAADADYWGDYSDGDYRYARIGIKGCYGDNLMLGAYIKLLPAQFTPTIVEMTRGEFFGSGGSQNLVSLTGKLDVENMEESLYLQTNYEKADQQEGGLDVYVPVQGNIDAEAEIFKISFASSDVSTNIITSKVKKDGTFVANNVGIHSTVDLTNNQMANFYNLKLGNTGTGSGKLYLRINGDYVTAPEGTGKDGIEIGLKDAAISSNE